MSESRFFDCKSRPYAESAPRIWARAAFSSNDPAVMLDAAAESAVAGVGLLQPDNRIPTARTSTPPVYRISPPVNAGLLYAPPDFGDAVVRRGSSRRLGGEILDRPSVEPLL